RPALLLTPRRYASLGGAYRLCSLSGAGSPVVPRSLAGNAVGMPRTPQVPYLAIADALRARLDGGEWLPGEQVPSACQIADAYRTARTTAAKAVRVLAAEGRVSVVPNWGTFVAER